MILTGENPASAPPPSPPPGEPSFLFRVSRLLDLDAADSPARQQVEIVYRRLFRYAAFFLLPALCFAALDMLDLGFSPAYAAQWTTGALLLLLSRLVGRISFSLLVFAFWLVAFIHITIGLFTWGFFGASLLLYVTLAVFATYGLSTRCGLASLALSLLCGGAAALGFLSGRLGAAFSDPHLLRSATGWANQLAMTGIFGFLTVYFSGRLRDFWVLSLRQLQERERDYRLLAENITDVIWKMDLSGRLTYLSPSVTKMLGWSPAEILALPLRQLVPPSTFEKSRQLYLHARKREDGAEPGRPQVYFLQMEVFTRRGKPVWVETHASFLRDSAGRPVEILGTSRDITDRRGVEEDLLKLAAVIEQTTEGVVLTDLAGHIQYVNPAFETMTGFHREEVLGNKPSLLKSGEHSASFYQDLWRTIREDREWSGRIINRRKDGTLYTEFATISPLRNFDGEKVGYISIKRDITGQLELETRLQQARKMEAVGQLAGGVAHDFNNLIQVIVGYTEMVMLQIPRTSPARDSLNEVIKATHRAKSLVNQLLIFGRREALQTRKVDLNQFLQGLQPAILRVLGPQIECRTNWKEGLPRIDLDPYQVEQAILNLVLNAREAMPKGGKIVLETNSIVFPEAAAGAETPRAGPFLVLQVSDSGRGIAPEIRNRIFEPFFTTKTVGQGSGLGLATVYAVLERHKGFIQVDSEVGLGTTLRLYFPVAPDSLPARSTPEILKNNARRGDTILVADDDDQVRSLACLILEKAGYQVLRAADGREALALFQQHRDQVRLALLDAVMPGLNGRETAEAIRRLDPNLPIVFASGYAFDILEATHLPSGQFQVIRKPYDQTVLLERVLDALQQSAPAPLS